MVHFLNESIDAAKQESIAYDNQERRSINFPLDLSDLLHKTLDLTYNVTNNLQVYGIDFDA